MHDDTRLLQNLAVNESRKRLLEHEQKLAAKISADVKIKPTLKVVKGDNVFLNKLKINAVVLQAPDIKGDVLVQAGIMRITVSLHDVELTNAKKAINSSNVGLLSKDKKAQMGNVVDVRGENIEDALDNLEKFLDDAFLAGIETINIIHGKGTGALRKAIGVFLKNDLRVISHRLADFNAGGTGVTVVTLKN
jgi:DNA mismatch repair protein MutS2